MMIYVTVGNNNDVQFAITKKYIQNKKKSNLN